MNNNNQLKEFSVRVSLELYQALKDSSEAYNQDINTICRKAVRKAIKENRAK